VFWGGRCQIDVALSEPTANCFRDGITIFGSDRVLVLANSEFASDFSGFKVWMGFHCDKLSRKKLDAVAARAGCSQ
jgi:hypothetical protein